MNFLENLGKIHFYLDVVEVIGSNPIPPNSENLVAVWLQGFYFHTVLLRFIDSHIHLLSIPEQE